MLLHKEDLENKNDQEDMSLEIIETLEIGLVFHRSDF